jgi:hypothetical protein
LGIFESANPIQQMILNFKIGFTMLFLLFLSVVHQYLLVFIGEKRFDLSLQS